MIVDDCFNYHSLSLTIMFAIKRSMIIHDSLSKSRNVLASLPRIFFDTEVIPSLTLNFKAVLFLVTSRLWLSSQKMFHKHGRASYSSIRLHINLLTTPLLVDCFLRFFRFSHFLAVSVTVVQIFVQIIALLFFTGRWQCGSHISLNPPWLHPLTEKLSCTIIRSVKRKNYHELSCRI